MKDESFPKSIRIRKKEEFEEVLRKGKKVQGDFLVLYRLFYEDGPKFGFLIGKKIDRAAQRNRIKRILREIVRKNQDKFSSGKIVIQCIKPLAEINYNIVEKELFSLI
jgi:ribonuclease P protein component